jgi:hypothetical protein
MRKTADARVREYDVAHWAASFLGALARAPVS